MIIDFKEHTKTKTLKVYLNGDPVDLSITDKKTHRWALHSEMYVIFKETAHCVLTHHQSCYSRVFPLFDDTVTLRVAYAKKTRWFKARKDGFEEFKLTHKEIANKFKGQGESAY